MIVGRHNRKTGDALSEVLDAQNGYVLGAGAGYFGWVEVQQFKKIVGRLAHDIQVGRIDLEFYTDETASYRYMILSFPLDATTDPEVDIGVDVLAPVLGISIYNNDGVARTIDFIISGLKR